jgi:hypothetical protein
MPVGGSANSSRLCRLPVISTKKKTYLAGLLETFIFHFFFSIFDVND